MRQNKAIRLVSDEALYLGYAWTKLGRLVLDPLHASLFGSLNDPRTRLVPFMGSQFPTLPALD